jgi:hypothetical protein
MPQSASDIDRLEDEVRKGSSAAGALRSLAPWLQLLENDILTETSRELEKLSDQALRSRIGQIAGLRKLKFKLESASDAGKRAAEKRNG